MADTPPEQNGTRHIAALCIFPDLRHQNIECNAKQINKKARPPAIWYKHTVTLYLPVNVHPERQGKLCRYRQRNTAPEQSKAHTVPVDTGWVKHGKKVIQGLVGGRTISGISVHQLGQCQSQRIRQRFQRIDVREAEPTLPSTDRFVCYMELFRKGTLGQAAGFAGLGQKASERLCIHREQRPFLPVKSIA